MKRDKLVIALTNSGLTGEKFWNACSAAVSKHYKL